MVTFAFPSYGMGGFGQNGVARAVAASN